METAGDPPFVRRWLYMSNCRALWILLSLWRTSGVTIFSMPLHTNYGRLDCLRLLSSCTHISRSLRRVSKVQRHTDKLTQTEIHTTCIRVKARGANTLAWPTSADRTPTPRLRPRSRPIVSSSRLPARIYSLSCVPYAAVHPMNMILDFSREIAGIPRRRDLASATAVSSLD